MILWVNTFCHIDKLNLGDTHSHTEALEDKDMGSIIVFVVIHYIKYLVWQHWC